MLLQSNDTSAGPFFRGLYRFGLAACLGVLSVTHAAAQQTEAEQAALSERPLTQEEIDLRLDECRLPPPTRESLMGDRSVAITSFPDFRFLELLTFEAGYTLGDQDNVFVHPHLPVGGIGAADSCGEALYVDLNGGVPEHLSLTLMLRSGLDLLESYPSSYDQILENDQLKASKSTEYLVLPVPRPNSIEAVEPVYDTLNNISGVTFIDWTGEAIWLRNALFLPLSAEVSHDE